MSQEGQIQQVQESIILKKPSRVINRYKHNQLLYNYFVIRDFKSALELIEKLTQEHGDIHEYANQIQGYIYKMTGQLQKSTETFKKFLSFNEQDQEVLKTIAKNLQLDGRFKSSLDVAQKALNLKKNDWEVFYTIGNCYYAQKDIDKALINYKRAFELSINETTYNRLGKFYLSLEKYEEALAVYKSALNSQPQNNEIKALLGVLLLRMGQTQEAKKYLESVTATDTKSLLGLGSIVQDQENYDEALNYYRKLIAIHPTSAQVWNNIAMCYYGKQEILAAIISLKRAIYYDPFESTIHFNMGLVHLHEKQYMSAFHYFQTAITLNPDDSQSYMYLGIALNKLNDFQNACRSFERALELDKDKDYLIYLNYCIILLQKGDESSQYAQQIFRYFCDFYKEQEQLYDNRCKKELIQELKSQIQKYLRS
ncbi:unnamed protein product [Paramecium sonneborni]|uniref:Tetratricopeptide repeat protein n=1 Tax=Paramecium sonneborni TaxID=65129 RepID=A0A8S1KI19_9CILI|nr:unnamed protein product [Paramecium sonneborni]